VVLPVVPVDVVVEGSGVGFEKHPLADSVAKPPIAPMPPRARAAVRDAATKREKRLTAD
jgi:hypothetical protein